MMNMKLESEMYSQTSKSSSIMKVDNMNASERKQINLQYESLIQKLEEDVR